MNFSYVVTGVLRNGRRFKPMYFTSFGMADCINLYRGSVWVIMSGGRRKLIKRVWN